MDKEQIERMANLYAELYCTETGNLANADPLSQEYEELLTLVARDYFFVDKKSVRNLYNESLSEISSDDLSKRLASKTIIAVLNGLFPSLFNRYKK